MVNVTQLLRAGVPAAEEHPKLSNPQDLCRASLDGQFGGTMKSGTFVCMKATVWSDLLDGTQTCWRVKLFFSYSANNI